MKILAAVVLVSMLALVALGSPFGEQPIREHRYNSPKPILPMSFAHLDHKSENCVLCHHNYIDDTGGDLCMNCHMTNQEVWPLLEYQFHTLCRDCHAEKAAQGIDGGPPRECMACHLGDDLP